MHWLGVVPYLDVDRRQSFRTGLQEVVAVGEQLLHGEVRVRSARGPASFAQHSFDDFADDVRQTSTRPERKHMAGRQQTERARTGFRRGVVVVGGQLRDWSTTRVCTTATDILRTGGFSVYTCAGGRRRLNVS